MVTPESEPEVDGSTDREKGVSIANKISGKTGRDWSLLACVVAVAFLGVWLLQLQWNSPIIVQNQPRADQSVEFDSSVDSRSLPSEDVVLDELPIDADVSLVNLLDEWPDIAGALILRGVALTEKAEDAEDVVDVTIIGGRVNRWPSPPNTTSQPVWLSADGDIVLFPEGPGWSNRGVWSSLSRDDTVVVEPEQGALWSVSHQRRNLARLDSEAPDQYAEHELSPEIERVIGRFDQGFLVLHSLESGGSGFAVWTDEGAIVPIDIPVGAELLHVGSSSVLLRASQQGVLWMDVSELRAVTADASVIVDFEILSACMSPDETLVVLVGQEGLTVIEIATGLTLIHEPQVDDFAWITSDYLVFTRGDSLFASDLVSDPNRIAELSPEYSWGVASSGSACQPATQGPR